MSLIAVLSGFADSLIFTFLEAFHPIYEQYGFTDLQMAWTFVPIALGYIIAWISYLWPLYKQRQTLRRDPNTPPELRLWWLLFRKLLSLNNPLHCSSCSRAPSGHRPDRLLVVLAWPRQDTLDRADDILLPRRYRQLRHLHVHYRLHGCGLWRSKSLHLILPIRAPLHSKIARRHRKLMRRVSSGDFASSSLSSSSSLSFFFFCLAFFFKRLTE